MMSEERIIPSSEEEECCCCRASNVRLHGFSDSLMEVKDHQHCDLCDETLAAKTCEYPSQYDRTVQHLTQHVNLVANILLREFRKKGSSQP
jgi:hypothetical protein